MGYYFAKPPSCEKIRLSFFTKKAPINPDKIRLLTTLTPKKTLKNVVPIVRTIHFFPRLEVLTNPAVCQVL